MKKSLIILFLSTYLFCENYKKGESLYFKKGCTACHGTQGQGLHAFPKLANKKAYKLRQKLRAYQEDRIKTPQASVMTSYAKNLTDTEMEDIIRYLSEYEKVEPTQRYDDSYEEWGDGGS